MADDSTQCSQPAGPDEIESSRNSWPFQRLRLGLPVSLWWSQRRGWSLTIRRRRRLTIGRSIRLPRLSEDRNELPFVVFLPVVVNHDGRIRTVRCNTNDAPRSGGITGIAGSRRWTRTINTWIRLICWRNVQTWRDARISRARRNWIAPKLRILPSLRILSDQRILPGLRILRWR